MKDQERSEVISALRNISRRIGVACTLDWVRENIDGLAGKLELRNGSTPKADVWPSLELEAEMRADANRVLSMWLGGIDTTVPDCAHHVIALLERVRTLEAALPTTERIADAVASLFISDGGQESVELIGYCPDDRCEIIRRDREQMSEILCHHLLPEPATRRPLEEA